jgi:hypothetical protein
MRKFTKKEKKLTPDLVIQVLDFPAMGNLDQLQLIVPLPLQLPQIPLLFDLLLHPVPKYLDLPLM